MSAPEKVVVVALARWSTFSSTGDTQELVSVFSADGPQYAQLLQEVPLGNPPLVLTTQEIDARSVDGDTATVRAKVRATREGHRSEIYEWEFTVIRNGPAWQVWTVLPAIDLADPEAVTPTSPSRASLLATENRESGGFSEVIASTPASEPRGVQIPALSAWIIVITIAGVAAAGYLAPRIDNRRER